MPFGPKNLVELDDDLSKLVKIPGKPGYYINKDGDVFSVKKLNKFRDKNGYERVSAGSRLRAAIHRLLAITFLTPDRPDQTLIRHLDGNPRNNDLENLKWGTAPENSADTAKHGSLKGARNPKAKLDESTVGSILRMSEHPHATAESIGEFMGVSKSTVQAILSGQNWSHYTGIEPKSKSE